MKLFGEEGSKNLLIDFLNQLLPIEHKIIELTFKNPEQLGLNKDDRKAIFDIHCQNSKGERFIVEMQKAKIKFFKDRAVFYTTFPIKEQAEKGDWNFNLTPIYCVAILDFTFDDDREKKEYISNVQLKDQFCQIFYNKLTYIFIEMPRFNKQELELKSHFDKWLYFLKNLENFENIPEILNEDLFIQGFQTAEIANFDAKQLADYEESLKAYRDLKGVIDTSFEEGQIEGRHEKSFEIASLMKKAGEPSEKISQFTGLSKEVIENI
ncbi:MAG: hypothetical protein QG657_4748 [Acidobacteriota bacterium]|nr:hypothetical protein [Acidobacteriota bacterium]